MFGLFGIERKKPRVSLGALQNLSSRDFEMLAARLFEKMSYEVRLTPETRDAGIDALAMRYTDTGTEEIAIQCKHYPGRKVGVPDARDFYGALAIKRPKTRGHLVTSGSFSDDCKRYSETVGLELYDINRLLGLLEKYDVRL